MSGNQTCTIELCDITTLACDCIVNAANPTLLTACYRNCLDLAKENGIHSIAFPAISTGVYGYPLKPAAKIAVHTVCKWLNEHPDYEIKIIFSCFHQNVVDVYRRVYAETAREGLKSPCGY